MFERFWFYLIFPGIPVVAALWSMSRMVRLRKETTRLPLKEFPRPAGWSLQNRTEDLFVEQLLNLVLLSVAGVIAALFYMLGHSVAGAMILGTLGSAPLLLRLQKDLPKLMNHRLGLLGEQATGRVLDELSSPEFRVFHDFEASVGDGPTWNIDHIVVASHGVYAIETKTRRKKRKLDQNWMLTYDGKSIQLPERSKEEGDLKQAERAAEFLANKLKEWNPNAPPVKPVLVFPGWYVKATGKGPVGVLNTEQFSSYFGKRETVLTPDEVRAIGGQIREHCLVKF